jgi:hypothetical protein
MSASWQIFDQAFAVEVAGCPLYCTCLNTANKPSLPSIMCSGPENPSRASKRALGAHATRPRIDRVLHVGQLARRHRARTKCSRRADADRRHHLIAREIEHAPGRDGAANALNVA